MVSPCYPLLWFTNCRLFSSPQLLSKMAQLRFLFCRGWKLRPRPINTTKANQNPGSHCLVLDFVEVMMHHPTMAQLRFLFCRRGWLQNFDLIAPQQTITKFITAPWEDKIPSHLWSKRLKNMLKRWEEKAPIWMFWTQRFLQITMMLCCMWPLILSQVVNSNFSNHRSWWVFRAYQGISTHLVLGLC